MLKGFCCVFFMCLHFNSSLLGVKGSQEVHTRYENAVVEIAASLQLSRNILLALLSLQSWKPFMQRWMRANISSFNAKAPTTILDKTSKAANAILKVHYLLLLSSCLCHLFASVWKSFFVHDVFFLLHYHAEYEKNCRRINPPICWKHCTSHKCPMRGNSFKMVVNVVIYSYAFRFQEPELRHIPLVRLCLVLGIFEGKMRAKENRKEK